VGVGCTGAEELVIGESLRVVCTMPSMGCRCSWSKLGIDWVESDCVFSVGFSDIFRLVVYVLVSFSRSLSVNGCYA
jgi:hypothetical protein